MDSYYIYVDVPRILIFGDNFQFNHPVEFLEIFQIYYISSTLVQSCANMHTYNSVLFVTILSFTLFFFNHALFLYKPYWGFSYQTSFLILNYRRYFTVPQKGKFLPCSSSIIGLLTL